MKCKINDLDCFMENIPNSIKCIDKGIYQYIKEKLLDNHILVTGDIDCMHELHQYVNPNWVSDYKYVQLVCCQTKVGMRLFNLVENTYRLREFLTNTVLLDFDIYEDIEELLYCNFHIKSGNKCIAEIIGFRQDFKGNRDEKICALLDSIFDEDN